MTSTPAFQWYPADYLSDMKVRMLSWASRGVYMDLLCYCWREGFIPADSLAIAQLVGCHDLAIVEPCLKLFSSHHDDISKLVHHRLDEERQKQIEFRKERSESGLRGASKRWNNSKKANGSAIKQPMAKNGSSSSSSSSDVPPIVPKGTFEGFWSAYPKKIGKKDAERKWKQLKPDLGICLHAIEHAKTTEQWRKDGGQFIPHPATWLHQGRWDDAPKIELLKRPPRGIPQDPEGWAQWRDETYPGAEKISFSEATREIQKEFEQSTKTAA